MKGWETRPLGSVCGFQGGSQPPKSVFSSEPKAGFIRLLQIRDFKSEKFAVYIPESKKNRLCVADDIMIGRYGASVGQIHRGKAGAYNVALIKTIPNLGVLDVGFFYYYLTSPLFQKPLLATASRSAQDGFGKEDIADFPIPLPPLEEQRRIVAVLDEAFAAIASATANLQKQIGLMGDLKQSLLGKAFGGDLV